MKNNSKKFVTLITLTLSVPALAGDNKDLEIHGLKPAKIGVGSALVKKLNKHVTPIIYQVNLEQEIVDRNLPNTMTPYLKRPGNSQIKNLIMSDPVIKLSKSILKKVEFDTKLKTSNELATLLDEKQPHTFAITGSHIDFAATLPTSGRDIVTKHAIIAYDTHDVRFAGQLWREGKILCFNGNSGTYVKKRKQSGLEESPEPEKAIPVFQSIFEPALTVQSCRFIAPLFGPGEALDQAEKATIVVNTAKLELVKPGIDPTLAKKLEDAIKRTEILIDAANKISADATAATGTPQFDDLDLKAGEAAIDVKENGRKQIEKILKKITKPITN